MKKLMLVIAGLCLLQITFAQHQFYLGVRQGGGYIADMNKTGNLQMGGGWNGSTYEPTSTHTLNQTIHGAGASTRFELLYGFKKLRIGYQFDYMFFQMRKSVSRINPPEQGSNQSVFTSKIDASNPISKDHFIGNSVLVEYLAFEKDKFSISPNIFVGYFNRLNSPTIAGTKTFIQCGAGLMLGYKVGPATVYINPDYTFRFGKDNSYIPAFNLDDGLDHKYRITHSAMVHVGARIDLLPYIAPNVASAK